MAKMDQARNIREGEELALDKLQAFLEKTFSKTQTQLEIQQFPSGFSNLTYLLKWDNREWVLRRPPYGAEKISKGHDMGREYRVLSLVHPHFPEAPEPLVYSEDLDIIGAPFYIMKRIRGTILRAGQKVDISPETTRAMNTSMIDTFVKLHQLDIEQTGLIQIGKPEGYLQRQIEGWSKRYEKAQTEDIPAMHYAREWLAKNMPESPAPTFIHNDYKYDNIVLNPDNLGEVKAVLDWEMSTVGDPLTDLGIYLSYTVEENDPQGLRNFLPLYSNSLTRQELVQRYQEQRGVEIQNIPFYYAFALFKLGVVLQQIYYRYHEGFTKDPRFAPLIFLTRECALMSQKVIEEQKISGFTTS